MILEDLRVVPVVVIDDPSSAPDLVAALAAGGISCVEITLRTDQALSAIREAARSAPAGFLVGAGTVLTPDDVDAVVQAGARLVVSPGFDAQVLRRCAEHDVLAVPGVATATEVQRAYAAGFDLVKFFPALAMGGLGTIEALSAPFPRVRFMPSGGVDETNAAQYAASRATFAISGSWMAPRNLILERKWDEITRLSREAIRTVELARST